MDNYDTNDLRIICLTPCKNEAWILDRFLSCTSVWADDILLFDASTDNSREIAAKYPKVKIIDDKTGRYSEETRQERLLRAAREIPGRRLLLTLDCDEIINANGMDSPEWTTMKNASPGTVFTFKLLNIRPDMQHYWAPDHRFAWGYMDDGAPHEGTLIHSTRIPLPQNRITIDLNQIMILHYQFVDWDRMKSKHRWYQCFERVKFPKKSVVHIYRQYHHMDSISPAEIHPILKNWLEGYEAHGIDMSSVHKPSTYHWDADVAEILKANGARRFWGLDIWSGKSGDLSGVQCQLPRLQKNISRALLIWLRNTQPYSRTRIIKWADNFLSAIV